MEASDFKDSYCFMRLWGHLKACVVEGKLSIKAWGQRAWSQEGPIDRAGGVVLKVECLPSKQEALSKSHSHLFSEEHHVFQERKDDRKE
jgi:hypothetical protein